MAFTREQVAELLVKCHRRCCVCHRFCGVKIETDHIVPLAEGGTDDIDNAIPVCFECHAEIHSYNDKHPRGRKFTAEELREHRNQWLRICRKQPEALINANRETDVGPLQALIDELEFNDSVAQAEASGELGCQFQTAQFLRAIHEGAIAILKDEVRIAIIEAYRLMGSANAAIAASWQQDVGLAMRTARTAAQKAIAGSRAKIKQARQELLAFLGNAA